MEQTNNTSLQEDRKSKKKQQPVLLLLLFLALITTSVVGFILGRSAGTDPLGQVIDTILLSPEEPAPRTAAHLTGRVVYGDGSPAAGLRLELHSDPIITVTNDTGYFLFDDVPFGEHQIIAYHPDGSVAGRQSVNISQSRDGQGVTILQEDVGYIITIAVDIRLLEIVIQLENDQIRILPDEYTYGDDHGWVTTPDGSSSVDDGVVVSPSGVVYLPDGTIVLPGSDGSNITVILPDDTVVYPERDIEGNGYTIGTDGMVTLPDGTVIEPSGRIITPDGEIHTPGEGGIVVGDGTVTPVGGETPPYGGSDTPPGSIDVPGGNGSSGDGVNPPAGGDASLADGDTPPGGGDPISGNVPERGGDTSAPGNDISTPGGDTPAPGDDISTPGDNPPAPDDDDPSDGGDDDSGGDTPSSGSLSVYGEVPNSGYVQWTQNSTIDLFFNRTNGEQEKIAPGSSGYYQFRLENIRASKLNIQVSLTEGDLHLPLAFTLIPLDAEGKKLSDQAVSGSLSENGSLVLETDIAGGTVVTYRLDWEWPVEGNDELDTRIGGGENLVYLISMTIHAEEV